MAQGHTAQAHAPDVAHDALRERFVNEFTPYALHYLGVAYAIEDL